MKNTLHDYEPEADGSCWVCGQEAGYKHHLLTPEQEEEAKRLLASLDRMVATATQLSMTCEIAFGERPRRKRSSGIKLLPHKFEASPMGYRYDACHKCKHCKKFKSDPIHAVIVAKHVTVLSTREGMDTERLANGATGNGGGMTALHWIGVVVTVLGCSLLALMVLWK